MTVATMARTPRTIARHELIGLAVRVVEASDPTHVGCTGTVRYETMRTLDIEDRDGAVRRIPKQGTTFEFVLPADGSETVVTVLGDRLIARPARRTETTGDSPWR